MATDQYGRDLHYLRISLTDRCNFRCTYCMPEGLNLHRPEEMMTDDEIILLTRLFAGLGFDKIRLTGGEPTLRPHLVGLVQRITGVEGIRTLTMTTNGVLLRSLAQPLAEAGLQRVNISLDTLDPQRFCEITKRGALESVWEGITAAEEAGLTPIKINVVMMDAYSLNEAERLARITLTRPWQVRFIEWMPVSRDIDQPVEALIRASEVRERIEEALGSLEILHNGARDGEARLYRLPGAAGDLGFIDSVSDPFCDDCTRIRLTADGHMLLCLLHDDDVDLLTPLRKGASEGELNALIREGIWRKPKGHDLAKGIRPSRNVMSQIGG